MDEGQQQQAGERGKLDPDQLDPSGELRELLDQADEKRREMEMFNTRIVDKVREALGMGAQQQAPEQQEQKAPQARQQPSPASALPPPHQARSHRR